MTRTATAVCCIVAAFATAVSAIDGPQTQSSATTLPPPASAPDDTGEEDCLRFYAFGDWGWNGFQNQKAVADAMQRHGADWEPEFMVVCGDNFQVNGVRSCADPLWTTNLEAFYTHPVFLVDWYPVLGNHDYKGNPDAEIAYSAISRRWNMPARYYKVSKPLCDSMTVDIFFLDTSPFQQKYRGDAEYSDLDDQDTSRQMRWLDKELSRSNARWKIAVGHHPVYSSGKHSKELGAMPVRFGPVFARGGVDAYFSGHDHHLEHIQRDQDPVRYFVCGAHKVRPVKPVEGSRFAVSTPGFVAVSLTAARMTVMMIDTTSAVLETVRIDKR